MSLLLRWRNSTAAGILCVLQGCASVGPDFSEPAVPWLDRWQSSLYGNVTAADREATDLTFWWSLFGDPELDVLQRAARADNPSLRIAGLRVIESRAVLQGAGAARLPQQQLVTGGANYVVQDQSGGGDLDFTQTDIGLSAAWELDFWGRFARGIESADSVFFASVANQQDAQVLLSAAVADTYYAYRTAERRISIAKENAAIQQRSLDIASALFSNGENSELDLQQARASYFATLASIPALEQALGQIENALAALLGRSPDDLPELNSRDQRLPAVKPDSLAGVPAELLRRRPDVRSALWQAAAQSAQIGVAEADFYPSVALLGGFGWSDSGLPGTGSATSLTLGSSLRWNIFDWGLIQSNVQVQDVRLQQAIESYRSVVLNAAREMDNAALAMVKTRERTELLVEALHAAERSLELALIQYREG
ncbi:efflux transporter outer membrane subunit, partial [Luminiphilus syltensis]